MRDDWMVTAVVGVLAAIGAIVVVAVGWWCLDLLFRWLRTCRDCRAKVYDWWGDRRAR